MGEKFYIHVLNGFSGTVNEHNLEENVVVVYSNEGFSVDRV